MTDCGSQVPPAVTPTATLNPTATSQPTSTLTSLPIVTRFPTATSGTLPSVTPSSTSTSTPLPKDIFDNFEELSGHCLVRTAFGVVPSGATVEEQALSDSTIGKLWFSLSWSGGDLDLTLLQPDGTVIDPSVIEKDPINMKFTSEPTYEEYFIGGPQSGIWTARIFGKSTPALVTDYMLEVWEFDATIFSVNFDKDEYFPGEVMKISSSIEDSFLDSPTSPEYIYGVTMRVIVEDPAQQRFSFDLFDDGNHGDEEANDGIYANSFSNTQVTGIYKFFFQVSGLNNRDAEPFSRECFLANTVNAAPSPTPPPVPDIESKACEGKMEASKQVVVRAENEGGSDNCDYCRYAFNPKAVSTSAGILVTWRLGFDVERPEPNAYMRLLDDKATPIGDVNLLFERNWIGQFSSLARNDSGAVLTFCGRYDGIDRITSALLDPYGRVVSEHLRSPEYRACGRRSAEPVWTGSRQLFAWTSGYDVLLDIADANGNIISRKTIRTDGIENPQLAIGHERALMVVTTFTPGNPGQTHLAVHRFDLEGNELGEPVILDPLTYEVYGRIEVGNFKTPFIIPTARGWLLLASSRASGRYVAQLTPDGTLFSDPEIIDKDMYFPNGFEDAIPYGSGAAILGQPFGAVILFLSPDGTISQEWHEDPDEDSGFGDLLEHQGHLFWTYTSGTIYENPVTNQVLIRKLQCVP